MPVKPEVVESVNSKQPVLVANVLLKVERLDRVGVDGDGKPLSPYFVVSGVDVNSIDDVYQSPSVDIEKAAGRCVRYILGDRILKQGDTDVGLREQASEQSPDTNDQGQPYEGVQEAVRDGGDIVTTEGRISPPGPVSAGDDA